MTNKKFRRLLLLTFFSLILLKFLVFRPSSSEIVMSFSNEIIDKKYLDHRYDSLLNQILPEIANVTKLNKHINVNDIYDKNNICIYVTDLREIIYSLDRKPKLTRQSKRIALSCKDNFISLKPNVILIDSKFMSLLMLQGFNELQGSLSEISFKTLSIEEKIELLISDRNLALSGIEKDSINDNLPDSEDNRYRRFLSELKKEYQAEKESLKKMDFQFLYSNLNNS